MPKRTHYDCCKCKRRITVVGPGMPARWKEIRISESTGGGMTGIGVRISGLMAKSRYCDLCWPQDYRIYYNIRKNAQTKLDTLI